MTDADKRTIATDALETLGLCPIPDDSGRDAIHLAVEPVVAAEAILPGSDIGLLPDGTASHHIDQRVGIADPFAKGRIEKGQRFWLVLYPRTITSLRHVWSHPAFDDDGQATAPVGDKKAGSEAWLRDFCDRTDCPGYEETVALALNGEIYDEYLIVQGGDAHGEIPDEFWDHIEIVTGQTPRSRAKYFSCSC